MMGMRSDIAENQRRPAPLRLQPPALVRIRAKLDGSGKATGEVLDLDQTDGSDLAAEKARSHLTHHRIAGIGVRDRDRAATRRGELAQRLGLAEFIAKRLLDHDVEPSRHREFQVWRMAVIGG